MYTFVWTENKENNKTKNKKTKNPSEENAVKPACCQLNENSAVKQAPRPFITSPPHQKRKHLPVRVGGDEDILYNYVVSVKNTKIS